MKKLTKFFWALFVFFGFVCAQINLLGTLGGWSPPFNAISPICFDGYISQTGNSIEIYNADFSLRMQINIPVPQGQNISDVLAVSERVFNTDEKLELLISFSGGATRLFNETGSMLFDFGGGVANPMFHLTADGNYRLLIWRTKQEGLELKRFTEVYSLPGRREPSVSANSARIQRSGNPVSFAGINGGRVHLNLAVGNYTVQILNPQGRLINSVNVNAVNGLNSIDLRTNELARGVFILNVERAGISVLSQSITVD